MRKTVVLSLFMLCAVWVFAQTSPTSSSGASQSSQSSSYGQTSNSNNNETKVEGCLNGSSGNYTLTDSSGKTWQLSGDTSKLSDHVGHKVEITGTTSSGSESTNPSGSSAGSSSSSSQPTLNVTSMKHISSTCSPSH